jgi:signal transduction histidine kinase
MLKHLRIPLRFKILVGLLLLVTVVLGLITFTMARLFNTDKTTYIHDLTSVMAVHAAEEAKTLLEGYQHRLQFFARVISSTELSASQKESLIRDMFETFPEFVMVTFYEKGTIKGSVFEETALIRSGVLREDLVAFRYAHPLPLADILGGKLYIENSTLSATLPTLSLALALITPGAREPQVVEGVVHLGRLLSLTRRSKVFETFIATADGSLLIHDRSAPMSQSPTETRLPLLDKLQEMQGLGLSTEFTQDGIDMIGGGSRIEIGGLLLGVQIPKAAVYLTARQLLDTLIMTSLALLVTAALSGLLLARKLTRPIEQLSDATRQVAKGEFRIEVPIYSRDEIGGLATSFNKMANELHLREKALKDSQQALVQSEKMAAFGQLGAGIAHEVKNPLAGILGLSQLCLRKVENESLLHKNLSLIEKETRRCKSIIDNLMKFARQEKVSFERVDLNRVVEDTAAVINNQLAINGVTLKLQLSPGLPLLEGNANQLQQVLTNLAINAQQAMEGNGGTVTLATLLGDPGTIQILVRDNGPGIPVGLQHKIFEPFYTSKTAGKGTGLGLSVSYGIIKDHYGNIAVTSAPGEGATFTIILPISEGALPMRSADKNENVTNHMEKE